jgi:hypothetical protein
MKSWIGVVSFTADDLALPYLMRMLRDPKVPSATHLVILEAVGDVLTPFYCAKVSFLTPFVCLSSMICFLSFFRCSSVENYFPFSTRIR